MELIEKDGKYYQELDVVLLSNDREINRGDIISIKGIKELHIASEFANDISKETRDIVGKHLYIISDEEIKEGDWFISEFNNLHNLFHFTKDDIKSEFKPKGKKIIASTDKYLKQSKKNTGVFKDLKYELPQIPESFIQDYIKSYNEGSPISQVLVEVNVNTIYRKDGCPFYLKNDGLYQNQDEHGVETLYINESVKNDYTLKLHNNIINTFIIEKTEEKVYTEEEIIFGVRKMLASENIKFHYVREELPKFLEEAKKEIISFKTNLKK